MSRYYRPVLTFGCQFCNNQFQTKDAGRKYCSPNCAQNAKANPNIICPQCKKSFRPHKNQKYCTGRCHADSRIIEVPFVEKRLKCELCPKQFNGEAQFAKHIRIDHNMRKQDYVLQFKHGGIPPVCICGCGTQTNWRFGSYRERIRGHITQEESIQKGIDFKQMWANNPDMKIRKAAAIKNFYESEEGIATKKQTSERVKKEWEDPNNSRQAGIDALVNSPEWAGLIEKRTEAFLKSIDRPESQFRKKQSAIQKKRYEDPLEREKTAKLSKEVSRRWVAKTLKKLIDAVKDDWIDLILPDPYNGTHSRVTATCKKCKRSSTRCTQDFVSKRQCKYCNYTVSKGQLELNEFIKSLGIITISNDRKVLSGKEIDIYCPEQSIGIEYDGLYWHSTEVMPEERWHFLDLKRKLCETKGIRLIGIFEDEWLHKKELVKNMMRVQFGFGTQIEANKCTVKQLDSKTVKSFFQQNCLDEYVPAKSGLGMFNNNELVAALSLDKHSGAVQFCSKSGYEIRQALSVLLEKCNSKILIELRRHDIFLDGLNMAETMTPKSWYTDTLRRFNNESSIDHHSKTKTMIYGCSQGVFIHDSVEQQNLDLSA